MKLDNVSHLFISVDNEKRRAHNQLIAASGDKETNEMMLFSIHIRPKKRSAKKNLQV